MSYYPEFAQLMLHYLGEADRSNAWLAQRLGVNPSTVARWLGGETRPGSPETIVAISDVLGIRGEERRWALLEAAGYAYRVAGATPDSTFETSTPELGLSSRMSLNPGLREAVLIATLGSESQVIPLAAQLLLKMSEPLQSVVALHTRPNREPIQTALPELQATFASQPSWPELTTVEMPVDDILTPQQIEVFAKELYQELKLRVGLETRVHLLLAGGRKSMAMVGVTVAQMLLGPDDRVWYIYSDESLRLSKRSALQPDDQAQLIQVPLPQMMTALPQYTRSFQAETPEEAFRALELEKQRQLQRFVEQELTPAERELAKLVVQDVLTVVEAAQQLNKQPKTVTNQLNTIYAKAESTFGLQPDVGVKREFLRNQLRPYFDVMAAERAV